MSDRVQTATLPELFEAQAGVSAESVAVVCGEESLSYGELNARANRLARLLVARGVGVEDRVGLVLPRSVDLVVGVLAVLKAGAVYVPVDPGYPADRVAYVWEDAGPSLVVTVAGAGVEVPAGFRWWCWTTPRSWPSWRVLTGPMWGFAFRPRRLPT
ncbi:hypothetical protein DNK48_13865 [Streptomyces malaysiensis subsp. malaysiensis]|uniref:AMP-binding protein n=1 Tax=Streptomyces malaysiensis TaxID=92644 RepID=UPI00115E04B6|nr:AMP-binding protein [Streptomyces malaysiensis]QDL70310.1 hypothetical protein DNK48_13865 [Streptomyces malaysiensis]